MIEKIEHVHGQSDTYVVNSDNIQIWGIKSKGSIIIHSIIK